MMTAQLGRSFFMLDNCDRVCYNVKVLKKILRRSMNIKYGRKSI
jgi:hypothetical protein